MRAKTHQSQGSAEVWHLVRRQHGVITRSQLLAFGFSPKAIRHRISIGRLHPLRRGVYAVRRLEVSDEGRWWPLFSPAAKALFSVTPVRLPSGGSVMSSAAW